MPTTTPGTPACCSEFGRVSRRGFLRGTLAMAGATTVIGSAVVSASPASATSAEAVLVVLSMRGAADGLSLVVPYGDPAYYAARPRIGVPSDSLLEKDGFFGFHPRLAPLMPLWRAREMATVQAAGLPVVNRSHFSAMEELEDARPGATTRVGWLNRLVGTTAGDSPLQGFHVGGGVVPTALFGPRPVMASGDLSAVRIPGDDQWDKKNGRKRSLRTLWNSDRSTLGTGMRDTFAAIDDFEPVTETQDNRSRYPDTDLAKGLSAAARVIRGDVGVEVLTIDQGDWDMHSGLGTLEWGQMNRKAEEFAGAVAAFFDDLGSQRSKVTLLAFSEFGRRVAENSNYGLDHGYGNAMWVFGAGVKGGQHHGSFPDLSTGFDADVTVTTDYRDVLADVVASRFNASIPTVFPGLSRKTVGIMNA
ncbi:DUF1501 domain-containing protein [Nocardioides sp.]|uniref:DUF1501 domain-containing protein n=1 Tax=Nocardioides sp. TaxID=35761 RepID=UPI003561D1E4